MHSPGSPGRVRLPRVFPDPASREPARLPMRESATDSTTSRSSVADRALAPPRAFHPDPRVSTEQETVASWADADAAYDAPELGPLDLRAGWSRHATLPPLAVVFDSEPANRAMARRLVARGFPVAWFTHDEKNAIERGERLRGTRARTPRHAAEVAAYLPRASSRAGGDAEKAGGSPHHASERASRAVFRTLDALSLSDRGSTFSTSLASVAPSKSTNPFRRDEDPEDQKYGAEDDADPEPADDAEAETFCYSNDVPRQKTPFGSLDDGDENNPLLVIFAVSGDAEVESALERLLAGERSSSAKYVDRALLAGAVLVLTGPVSDIAAERCRRRCARAGVRLVAAATEGDARAAAEGALTVYVATASRAALHAAAPALAALARDARVVSVDARDAASARLARAVLGAPRETPGVASLRATGATAAAVAAERRAIALEKQLESFKKSASEAEAYKKKADVAEARAHEADARAIEAMERNAELRVEIDSKTAECARLASTCASMDRHLHMGGDEKTKEIDALRAREAESTKSLRELHAELAAARNEVADVTARLEAEKREVEARLARHEEARVRDAESVAATKTGAEARLRVALDEALDAAKAERRENEKLRERLGRLESVRRDFDELSRRADADVADAEDRADLATRRAEKAENRSRRRDEKVAAARDEAAAARDAEAETRRELETVKSALVAANAKRDADAALARESADREAALAVAAADVARADAEARARKAYDALTEAGRRRDAAEADARRLAGEVASARDELKQYAASAHVVSRLEIELQQEKDARASLELERARLERVVVEAHAERSAVVAAATATAEREARRQREVAAEESRLRLEAEAAGFRAARERDAMAESVRAAEEQARSAEIAEARARRELAAERVAGEAAHAALADIGHETSRLASEIEDARTAAARSEAGRRRAAEAAGAEASAMLRDALDEAAVAARDRPSPASAEVTRPRSARGGRGADSEFAFDSTADSPRGLADLDDFASPSSGRFSGGSRGF